MKAWKTGLRRGECYRVSVTNHGTVANSRERRFTLLEKAYNYTQNVLDYTANCTVVVFHEYLGSMGKRTVRIMYQGRSGDPIDFEAQELAS